MQNALTIPEPKVQLTFRLATLADIPWMDSLQKQYGESLGFFKTQMYEGYIKLGAVRIAEIKDEGGGMKDECRSDSSFIPSPSSLRVGYIISRDRYLKRDELGVVFQLCVDPRVQRGYVGAALVREVFENSAYGCRLYCLWCAQDLKANEFWEAMGFVPLAFRAGSDKKRRVHIFWQKKIVAPPHDAETKWWYPFQTTGGAIRADRMVFPIPEGTHWRDVKAIEIPAENVARDTRPCLPEPKKSTGKLPVPRKKGEPAPMGGFRFQAEVNPAPVKRVKTKKIPDVPVKIDAAFLAKGRELRDRWLEHINANPVALLPEGKYDLVRQWHLSATASRAIPLLPAA